MRAISISVVVVLVAAHAAVGGAAEPAAGAAGAPETCWQLHERFANQALVVRDFPEMDAARRHLQQAIDCMPAAAPPGERARILERLGSMCEEHEPAIAYYTEALRLRRSVASSVDPAIPDTLANLGSEEIAAGRRSQGIAHIEEAHSIQEKTLGPDHPQTALGLYRLGITYFADGQPDKGEAFFRRSIAILEKQPLTEDLLLSSVVLALGDRLCEIGRCAEGQALREISLELSLKAARAGEQRRGEPPKPH
jgi:serine/threonine-protein kinase